MTELRATARFQFHREFVFEDAVRLVPYLAKLGISHLYSSPIMVARPGSTHGYDTIDHRSVNPELGGETGLARLVDALRAHDMHLMVDIVPNHMASDLLNPWWSDVLTWGPLSHYANYFDIDWTSENDPTLEGKVLLPVLGCLYGEALENGELGLVFEDGRFLVSYFENRFPICPTTYTSLWHSQKLPPEMAAIIAQSGQCPSSAVALHDAMLSWGETPAGQVEIRQAIATCLETDGELHALLEKQFYRLAFWRTAPDIINWRRFFDITGLVGVRVETAEVFDAVHERVLALHSQGLIDALRIDHVDGLLAPGAYCRRLRAVVRHDTPIYVEKILEKDEVLEQSWSTDGTTGYDFLDQVSAVLHDPDGELILSQLWTAASESSLTFDQVQLEARVQVLDSAFTSEFHTLIRGFFHIAQASLETCDMTEPMLARGLKALLLAFPCYRSYFADEQPDFARSAAMLHSASTTAKARTLPSCHSVIDWLTAVLENDMPRHEAEQRDLRGRFEHLTAPLTAKSVEDTSFYRYCRLLSRNDVGCDPGLFSISVDRFHDANIQRRSMFPMAMLSTATHDHKRGEDTRARLAVLSEPEAEWPAEVTRWSAMNSALRLDDSRTPVPDNADELMLYQSLIGAWPMSPPDAGAIDALRARLQLWLTKALKEAKRHTGWTEENKEYESRCAGFLDAILDPERSAPFLQAVDHFVRAIAPAGALNALSQTVLRLTCPGMPDLYQGTEYWDLSLVDPDNRCPVDFDARLSSLRDDSDLGELARHWQDGVIKQHVIHALLTLRRHNPALFRHGTYEPLRVSGPMRDHVIAFMRRYQGASLIVIAPRRPWAMRPDLQTLRVTSGEWKGTTLHLPDSVAAHETWRNVLLDTSLVPGSSAMSLGILDGQIPLAVLASGSVSG